MGFSRQEYWSGLPLPSPGALPSPEIEPVSPALKTDSLPLSPQGSPFSPSVTLVVSVSCGCVTYHYKQSLIVLEARSVKLVSLGQKSRCHRPFLLWFRERFVPISSTSWWLLTFLACDDITPISASIFTSPSLCLCQISVSLSLTKMYWWHLGQPIIQDYLPIWKEIWKKKKKHTSAKSLYPDKAAFTGSGYLTWYLQGHHLAYYTDILY